MKKESKRVKIGRSGDWTPVDMSNFWADSIKRKEEEQEKERIDNIVCPACKSTDKIHCIKRDSNGIMGPGFSSWVIDEYLICKSCGVHYSDVSKFKSE